MKALVIAFAACWAAAVPAHGADVALGRALYQGTQPFAAGAAATASRLPPDLAACTGCHGGRGEGRSEGNVTAPALRWEALRRSRDGLGAYVSAAAVLAAIRTGHGRDGHTLAATMPRFTLDGDEADALVAYLRVLGDDADQPAGVSGTVVRLGTILPLSGPRATIGQAVLAGLQEPVARANAAGGIHGRRLELIARDSAQGVSEALASLKSAGVYALVGGVWSEDQTSLDGELAAAHVAHVASLVMRTRSAPIAGWSADLMPSRALQRAALVQALHDCPRGVALLWPLDADAQAALRDRRTGCIGYTLESSAAVERAIPAAWDRTLVLPFPAALLDRPDQSLWSALGVASGEMATELLSRAGRGLHERSLLDGLDQWNGSELPSGASLRFARNRRHGWDPQLVQTSAHESITSLPGASP